MSFLFGSKPSTKQMAAMSPQQMGVLNQLLSLLGNQGTSGAGSAFDYYSDLLGGGGDAYSAFSAPYMREFQEQIVPGLAEQFAGVGALSSSAFPQALSQAGAGLQEKLAALRGNLQMQGAQGLMSGYQGLSQLGLGAKPFGYGMNQGSQGLLQSLFGGLGSSLGTGLGLGGSMGIMKHYGFV